MNLKICSSEFTFRNVLANELITTLESIHNNESTDVLRTPTAIELIFHFVSYNAITAMSEMSNAKDSDPNSIGLPSWRRQTRSKDVI